MGLIDSSTQAAVDAAIRATTDTFFTNSIEWKGVQTGTRNNFGEIVAEPTTSQVLLCYVKKSTDSPYDLTNTGAKDEDKLEVLFDGQYLAENSVIVNDVILFKQNDIFNLKDSGGTLTIPYKITNTPNLAGWFIDKFMIVKVIIEKK